MLFIHNLGANSSDDYRDVLDMCSDTSIITNASYLISPAFPDGFSGTGSCTCTAEHADKTQSYMNIIVEHVMLSDEKVCNEEILIFKNGKQNEYTVSECSPSIISFLDDMSAVRNITVSFRRKLVASSRGKTVVWIGISGKFVEAFQWRHNERDGVSNHQPHDCLLNRLFRRWSKKHQSSASLALVRGIHQSPVNSPHKWPVTRKMFPFDDVIMSNVLGWVGIMVNSLCTRDAIRRRRSGSTLDQVMARRLFDARPLSEPRTIFNHFKPSEQVQPFGSLGTDK